MSSFLKIDQDFAMMFGDEMSSRFLAKWPTFFKPRVITDCKALSPNQYVEELLLAIEPRPEEMFGEWNFLFPIYFYRFLKSICKFNPCLFSRMGQ